MSTLTPMQEQLCEDSRWDYSDLRALYLNCTLKRSPEASNTAALADGSMEIMRRNGVAVELVRAIDHDLATGVQPDMTEHGWEHDGWPSLYERVLQADILVLLCPIWLGEKSSVCNAGDRAPVRQQPSAQRPGPVRLSHHSEPSELHLSARLPCG
jgi:hypothetical protein